MIKMYDPTIDYKLHKNEYNNAIQTVLNHGKFIMGPEIYELEKKLSEYCDVKHSITVSNGTDALMIALMALDIRPGDEIITVPFTWIATAEVISILGATPVFVDIDFKTYNMDPSKLEDKITMRTRAIIPVSLYGQMADLKKINKIAEKYDIAVIEDGAQSFGAMYDNKKSCSCSYSMCQIACTSFFPSKPLGCYGDGGCCFTNNDYFAHKLRSIRTHGGTERFKHKYIGTNARLNTIQAAILLVKLRYFDESLIRRRRNAKIYNDELRNDIVKPFVMKDMYHVYGQYTIRLKNKDYRDGLKEYLKNNGIESSIFYPISLHTQEAFQKYGYGEGDYIISENICERVLSIPCYPELEENEIKKICQLINKYEF